jgi:FdhE protein
MRRVLDPAQIEAFGQRAIPRVCLPSADLFATRAARFRKLSQDHALGDYLRLMAVLCEEQDREFLRLQKIPLTGCGDRMALARAHGMPLLQVAAAPRDDTWRSVLGALCEAVIRTEGFPPQVGETCRLIRARPAEELEGQADRLLAPSGAEGVDAQAAPFLMAALQVYQRHLARELDAETVAEHAARMGVPTVCPVCGGAPVASVVRADKRYEGYRYLHCGLCDAEWHMVRIKCSHCETTEGIQYHCVAGGSTAIRAESCNSCRLYRKICYQEHDPEVEPVADDLASLALDLLMGQEGFARASGHPLLWQDA